MTKNLGQNTSNSPELSRTVSFDMNDLNILILIHIQTIEKGNIFDKLLIYLRLISLLMIIYPHFLGKRLFVPYLFGKQA